MRWLWLATLTLAACGPYGFSGDDGKIWFTDSLDRAYQGWSPAVPVAAGSTLDFTAASQSPVPSTAASRIDPDAGASIGDGGALEVADAGPDVWSARALAEGVTAVRWAGALDDRFEVVTREAATLELVDPLAFYRERYPQYADAGLEVDLGSTLHLAPGGRLYLELVPRDDGGTVLFFEQGWAEVDAGLPYHASLFGQGVVVTAPPQGPASGELTVTVPGRAVSTTVHLETPFNPFDEVARLELADVAVTNGYHLLKATAFRADGGVLYEPPLSWSIPSGIDDLADAGPPIRLRLPQRRDARILSGYNTQVIGVSMGGLDASVEVPFPPLQLTLPPGSLDLGCPGCSGAGAGWAVAGLIFALLRRRRP